MKILLVDDNPGVLKGLTRLIATMGHDAHACSNGAEAVEACRDECFPMVITDVRMPGMDGFELLAALQAMDHMVRSDVVICTGHGDMEMAIEALRKGAYDFVNKPVNADELAALVERCCEHQSLLQENRALVSDMDGQVAKVTQRLQRELADARSSLAEVAGLKGLVAASPAMAGILEEVRVYHEDPEVPVLIEGETGTGKEVIARLIHFGPGGVSSPFVAVNCSAISGDLFESELFGYEDGAFTGSRRGGATGKLELADSGALFLDEVGDMPLPLQPKLLRAIETRSYYQVGGVKKKTFSGRLIAATNADLTERVAEGAFRADLYHRLHVGHIRIPPLRERPEDILPLAEMFLQREALQKRKRFESIAPDAQELLCNYGWPGNVRELENAIQRSVLLSDDTELRVGHLSFLAGQGRVRSSAVAPAGEVNLEWIQEAKLPDGELPLASIEAALVARALEKWGGNKSRTAEYLGLSRGALRNRLRHLE